LSILYVVLLCGVSAVIVGVMFDAIARVSKKPVWHSHRPYESRAEGPLVVATPLEVAAVDPRHSGFVGLTNDEEFRIQA
jgi:hypothetical protein